jgi:hypothetical protein
MESCEPLHYRKNRDSRILGEANNAKYPLTSFFLRQTCILYKFIEVMICQKEYLMKNKTVRQLRSHQQPRTDEQTAAIVGC